MAVIGQQQPRLRIPFQSNQGGIIALLPDGTVDYFHPDILPLFEGVNSGELDPAIVDFSSYIVEEPVVCIDNFHLSAPLISFIEVTNLCNLSCKHCYAMSGPQEKRTGEMTTETIFSAIDDLGRAGALQLFLTGGEIFSHPDAVDIINRARQQPFATQIFTNGTLIKEEHLADITPGTSFYISFDTAVPERTIRGKMDFPMLRECFEAMKRHGHAYRTAVSVHRYNLDDIEGIFRWCLENGYPRPQWLETHPLGRALLHPGLLLQPEHIEKVFQTYVRCMEMYLEPCDNERIGGFGGLDTAKFTRQLEVATRREKCARSTLYISSNGDVYPCSNCLSRDMYRGGNLHETALLEIWERHFDDIRAITFDDHADCRECPVNEVDLWCQFRCPPLAAAVSGDEKGCGATEYMKLFMLRVDDYWSNKRPSGTRLALMRDPVATGRSR